MTYTFDFYKRNHRSGGITRVQKESKDKFFIDR